MKLKILFSILIGTISTLTQASTYKLNPQNGKISFTAKGKPALISIRGEGEGAMAQLEEKDNILKGEVLFQLKTLKAGIELRDDHMKNKYLEVEKYPFATLKIANLKLPENLKNEFTFNAILNLHGVDQIVEVTTSIAEEPKAKKISAEFKINLSRFNIEIPNFKGITVAEEVQVKAESLVFKEE